MDQGKEALIVKSADIYDNTSFFIYASKEIDSGLGNYEYLITKNNYFAQVSEIIIKDEPIYQLMLKRLEHFHAIIQNRKKIS